MASASHQSVQTGGASADVRPGNPDGRAAAWIAAATLVAYLPALAGGFIWDDDRYVTKAALQPIHGLWRIWFEVGASEQYYPLLHSFFWVQHRLWGDDPLGYHVVTLLLHIASAILFGVVLRRLEVPGAWLAAMLFALHPVHAESVAWITEQKNTCSLLCLLAAVFVYLRFDQIRRQSDYFIALAWFVCSIFCKTVTVTLPAALWVVFWWKRGRLEWRKDVRPLIPWLAIGAAAGLFGSWVERRFLGAEGKGFELSLMQRGLEAGRSIWFYLGHLAWPSGLNFIYPGWTPDTGNAGAWIPLLAAVGLGAGLWAIRSRTRAPLAAYLLYLGTLFPVMGFVNLYGGLYSSVWDHWQYLPDLAPIALAAAGLTLALEHVPAPAPWRGAFLAVSLGLVLGGMTWIHCGMFHDNETLYRATLDRNPGSWMAQNNLAILLKDSGRTAEAIDHYERALLLTPNRPEVIHNNLGIAFAELGRLPEAIGQYEDALQLTPGYPDADNNLGIAFAKSGQVVDAIPCFEQALHFEPGRADIQRNLARALATTGRLPEAIDRFEEVVRLQPDSAEARVELAMALRQAGQTDDAMVQFKEAIRLKPELAQPPPGRSGD